MDASQVGNAYEHALRELATAQAENARLTSEVVRLREALEPIVRAYVKQSDPIGDSDLNGMQPRSVSMTLGDWRRAERAL